MELCHMMIQTVISVNTKKTHVQVEYRGMNYKVVASYSAGSSFCFHRVEKGTKSHNYP